MFLYKIEIEAGDGTAHAVIIADSDEHAFEEAEVLLLRHFGKPVSVTAMTLIEKKRIEKGAGYLIR